MEDVYMINVDHLLFGLVKTLANVKWIKDHGGIPVDRCIGEEVEFLINMGVTTHTSCCGHGKYDPVVLAGIESKGILEELGYEFKEEKDILAVKLSKKFN